MPTFKIIGRWVDRYLLLVLGGFLLGFIPLYPKLPLFDLLPGYLVRVRLEDFFIALATAVWLVQLARKKITWRLPLTKLLGLYLLTGLLSLLSAIFVTKTIPLETLHIGKSALHLLRYLEYFTLFFIIFTALKTKKDLRLLITVSFLTLFVVCLYGVGQRYLYWPVYSTMNREFSQGLRLYLTPHARVQSTFAGHYDLGGYLVLTLPFVLAAAYSFKKKPQKIASYALLYFGLWLIVASASRTSFAALILALVIVILLFALEQMTIKMKILWFARQVCLLATGILLVLAFFGKDMYERLLQVLEGFPVLNSWQQQADVKLFSIAKPENALSTEEAEALASVLVSSDERPSPQRPSDVYVNVPDNKLVATVSADGVATTVLVQVDRTYSQTAIDKGLSYAIRLDTLWPREIEGFKRNPVFGSGYATLTKETIQQFTEAESTDNNYLRTLGETGLAGFLTFYGSILAALTFSVRTLLRTNSKLNQFEKIVLIGFIAGSLGLLLNAYYIDVFVASKIAQLYWAYAGMAMVVYSWRTHARQ